uniref:polyhydroxyalkanoic acid system family protein n=1 Tax=Parerythrobacter lutipelagi TaxID=1964208 RepID=UPI0010F819D5|nr:polyhydroxyalkanoic acid system family protein [Parerythrobacter lutipelagi]
MRVAVPHNLPREEVRKRLRERTGEIVDHIPFPGATVESDWVSDDRLALMVGAMGQQIQGHVDVEDGQMVFEVQLPMMLSFVEPMIAKGFKEQGTKMLEGPGDKGD